MWCQFQNSDVIYVGTTNAVSKEKCEQSNSGYMASSSSTSASDISFGSPPDWTDFLRMLYQEQGHLIPDISLRPPPRDDFSNLVTTPKKDNAK